MERRLMLFESINLHTDFERRAQFNVHCIHEMVLREQQQGLSVNLLWPELSSNIMAPLEQVEKKQRLAYDSKDHIEIYELFIPVVQIWIYLVKSWWMSTLDLRSTVRDLSQEDSQSRCCSPLCSVLFLCLAPSLFQPASAVLSSSALVDLSPLLSLSKMN